MMNCVILKYDTVQILFLQAGCDMSNIIEFKIGIDEANIKLKEYLKGKARFSSRLTREAAREGRIKINNKVARLNQVLNEHDIIQVQLNKEESQNVEPEEMELDIVFEDADIIVLNKKPGMVVHPTRSYISGTLANGLLHYFKVTNQNCIVRLVSRLDMDTSGLILVAKNQFSHMSLARDMQSDTFEKSYMAIVHGTMPSLSGTIDEPIFKPSEESIRRVVHEEGQRSITHYEVVEALREGQLLKLILETGRTHQIRVHLSHKGCPIYGDSLYGEEEQQGLIGRQALHAYKLAFPHPRDGRIVKLEVGLPEDMEKLLKELRK